MNPKLQEPRGLACRVEHAGRLLADLLRLSASDSPVDNVLIERAAPVIESIEKLIDELRRK